MSNHSKSVSFEEYRQKSWRDVCEALEQDRGACGDYHNGGDMPLPPKRFADDDAEDVDRIRFYSKDSGDSGSLLPPPSCMFQGEGKRNEISDNYIMPSLPSTRSWMSSKLSFLTPPTPFKDDIFNHKKLSRYEFSTNDIISEEDYDLIEIKSPPKGSLQTKESNCGLTTPSSLSTSPRTSPRRFKGEKLLFQTTSDPIHQSVRMRTGLFDLPEVYCPPPLRPPQQRPGPISPSRVMPSFFRNNFNSPRHAQFQSLSSPRLAYSQPIMKSERYRLPPHEPTPTVRPEAIRADRSFIVTPTKKKPYQTRQNLEGPSFSFRRKCAGCRPTLFREQRSPRWSIQRR